MSTRTRGGERAEKGDAGPADRLGRHLVGLSTTLRLRMAEGLEKRGHDLDGQRFLVGDDRLPLLLRDSLLPVNSYTCSNERIKLYRVSKCSSGVKCNALFRYSSAASFS